MSCECACARTNQAILLFSGEKEMTQPQPMCVQIAVSVCVLALFGAGSTTPTCPAVTTAGYNCTTTSPNCTGMTCQGPSTDTLMSATASISLQSCDDPPLITLEAWGVFANNSRFNFTHRFQRSESVFIGGANIGATVQRNLTSLQFSAYLATTPLYYLIPPIEYAINTTECLCNSMEQLVDKISSPFEHNCSTTEDCDGVRCVLDLFSDSYIVEMYTLSCAEPPAVDVLVEDDEGNPFYSQQFDSSLYQVVEINGIPVLLEVILVHHSYSMELEVNLLLPFISYNIIPQHNITLDPTSCHTPPTATPTDRPSPPPDSSDLCNILYDIANATEDPLFCSPVTSCTHLLCDLTTGKSTAYEIDIRFLPRESDVKAYLTVNPVQTYMPELLEVTVSNEVQEFGVDLEGSVLVVIANATTDILSLTLILREADQPDSILLPPTAVTLPSGESCLWWVPVIADHPTCSYLPDCQGILCITPAGHIDSASLSLDSRCGDPLSAGLLLESNNGGVSFRGSFTESDQFEYGFVTMQRSDTQLDFSADALSDDILEVLVPPVTISLDPHMCSCQSLAELANKTQSPLEHDCTTNEVCDGIRCVLDVFGTIYHLETVLLSCNDPPALETVVENEDNVPLFTSISDHTGVKSLQVFGLRLPLYVFIEHHDYSMDVAAYVTFNNANITIVPPSTLFLDRTSCREPPTVPPSPPCQALTDIAEDSTKDGLFVCKPVTDSVEEDDGDCNTLECELSLPSSNYTLTLELYPEGDDSVVVTVTVASGEGVLTVVDVKESRDQFKVMLEEGDLKFDFQPQGKAMAIQVTLTTGDGMTTTLINSTVPLQDKDKGSTSPSSSHHSGTPVGVIVIVVVVVVGIVVTVVIVVLIVWYRRRRHKRQFEFQHMSYADVQKQSDKGTLNDYEPLDSTLSTTKSHSKA